MLYYRFKLLWLSSGEEGNERDHYHVMVKGNRGAFSSLKDVSSLLGVSYSWVRHRMGRNILYYDLPKQYEIPYIRLPMSLIPDFSLREVIVVGMVMSGVTNRREILRKTGISRSTIQKTFRGMEWNITSPSEKIEEFTMDDLFSAILNLRYGIRHRPTGMTIDDVNMLDSLVLKERRGFIEVDKSKLEEICMAGNLTGEAVKKLTTAAAIKDLKDSRVTKSAIRRFFQAVCSDYGYGQVAPPFEREVAKAWAIHEMLHKSNDSITVFMIIETMVKNWGSLRTDSMGPFLTKKPSLGGISVYYERIYDMLSGISARPEKLEDKAVAKSKPLTFSDIVD